MNLYEYQAKEILAQCGVPVPDSRCVTTAAETEAASKNAALKWAGESVVEDVDDVAQAMAGTMAAA